MVFRHFETYAFFSAYLSDVDDTESNDRLSKKDTLIMRKLAIELRKSFVNKGKGKKTKEIDQE